MVKRMRAGCAAGTTDGAARGWRGRLRLALVAGCATILVGQILRPGMGEAQQAQTLDGAPVQVQPTALEPGVPAITVSVGTPNPFPGNGGAGTGTGSGTSDGTGDGTGGGSGGGATAAGDSSALSKMLSMPWGATAVSNAQTVGINPSALAATCVVESGCQNVGGSGSNGTITGAFQMSASTYTSMINAAVAANPSLASQVVPGLAGQNDPATQSIAASEYLLQGSQYLQSHGIAAPTITDVRGYYNFGPAGGAAIANATSDQTMASVLSNFSASTLAKNGITSGETVGQWQAGVAAKIGNAATQSVTL
jgi:hypothetical protein